MGKKNKPRRSRRLNPIHRRQNADGTDPQQQQQETQPESQPNQQPATIHSGTARRRLQNSSETSSSGGSTSTGRTTPPPSTYIPKRTETTEALYTIQETADMSVDMEAEESQYELSELEASSYYAGLSSQPRLLARSGTDPWPPAAPPFSPEERATYGDNASPLPWTAEFVRKRLGPIDGPFHEGEAHPLIKAWPEIQGPLVSAVDSPALNTITTLMFPTTIAMRWLNRLHQRRHKDCETSQVTVLLGMNLAKLQQAVAAHESPGATGETVAMGAVQRCKVVLEDSGFTDVQVEAYDTDVFLLSDEDHDLEKLTSLGFAEKANKVGVFMPSPEAADRILTVPYKFLHFPGQMLQRTKPVAGGIRYEQTAATGSLGLYLHVGPKPASKVLALTSRHVAVGDNHDHSLQYAFQEHQDSQIGQDDQEIAGKLMILWGEKRALEMAAEELRDEGKEVTSYAQRATKNWESTRSQMVENDITDDIDDLFTFVTSNLTPLCEAIENAASSSYGNDDGDGDDDKDLKRREVGHVLASAPLGPTPEHHWSDWALIELTAFAQESVLTHRPRNQIFAGRPRATELYRYITKHHPGARNTIDFLFSHQGMLMMKGTRFPGIPNTTDTPKDESKGKAKAATPISEFVLKKGAKTGVTLGLTNEVEAVVRMPYKNSRYVLAYHLLIYPTDTGSAADLPDDRLKEMFSAPGDSGSAVVGLDGCVVAMIDAGAGRSALGRVYQRPPAPLPTAQDQGQARVDETAAAAFDSAKRNMDPPPGYRPATVAAIPGQGNLHTADIDVTLATPIDWVLGSIEDTLGQPVHLL